LTTVRLVSAAAAAGFGRCYTPAGVRRRGSYWRAFPGVTAVHQRRHAAGRRAPARLRHHRLTRECPFTHRQTASRSVWPFLHSVTDSRTDAQAPRHVVTTCDVCSNGPHRTLFLTWCGSTAVQSVCVSPLIRSGRFSSQWI